MKKPNITPGPWRILDDYYASFYNEFTPRVEDVWEIGNREEGSTPAYATSEAHAQAIAALPDLLELAEYVLGCPGEYLNAKTRAVLTKAGYTF